MVDFVREFMGQGNFTWFIGKVEDRKDPLLLGRVRVRCFGWHSDDKSLIPTDKLPWASTVQPVTNLPAPPSGLTEETWVLGFFLDGSKAQRPMILGLIPGYKFSSPGESDLPRLGRVETSGTETGKDNAFPTDYTDPYQTARKAAVEAEGSTTDVIYDPVNDLKWTEPEEPKDAEYPYVQTLNSEGGIINQIVSSEDGSVAREVKYHPSGSYEEMQTDGTKIVRIEGDRYQILAGTDFVRVTGDVNLTVDANVNRNITGNVTENIAGNVIRNITGTLTEKIDGAVEITMAATKTENVAGDVTETYGNQTTDGGGAVKITAGTIDLN